MFLHLCVDRVREKIFHEKTGLGMFGDDRGKRNDDETQRIISVSWDLLVDTQKYGPLKLDGLKPSSFPLRERRGESN